MIQSLVVREALGRELGQEKRKMRTHAEPFVDDVDLFLAQRSHLGRTVTEWRHEKSLDRRQDLLPQSKRHEVPSCFVRHRGGSVSKTSSTRSSDSNRGAPSGVNDSFKVANVISK